MKTFKSILPVFFLLLFVVGCAKKENTSSATYFGGKIINPKSNIVLFMQNNKVIDTLLLNKNNTFLKKFDNLSEGLYVFKHGPEFQYIYLEPKDSILIRINTWDFDESLVFNGKGSTKNEFLINLFLENEKIDTEFYANFELKEANFLQKLKEIEKHKDSLYSEFKKNQPVVSDGFNYLIQSDSQLFSDIKKELYSHYHQSFNNNEHPKLSPDFYNFRKKINLNDKKLLNFFRYQNYIINYLYNSSYTNLKGLSKDKLPLAILKKINKEITLPKFKDELLYRIVIDDFYADEKYIVNQEVLDYFYEHSNNEEHKKSIQNLIYDRYKVKENKPINNFEVKVNHKKTSIKPIIKDKNTVLYFWSSKYISSEALSKRIHFLEKKFTKLHFVGINFDKPSKNPYLKKSHLKNQYQLPKDCKARSFLKSNFPRTILINSKGKVVNSFTSLNSHAIENQLAALEKK